MPEDWSRGLAVVAHPDDLEYGASSAVARWTDQGRDVAYLLACRGEAGIDSLPPAECGPLREAEQRAAAAAVGVSVVEFLDGHPDGLIEYGIPLRRDIAAAIRRHRPELVVTGNLHETWFGGGGRNMADHIAVGRACVDAVRDAANRWLFSELGEPWGGVRWVAVAGSPLSGHGVVVDDHIDRGIASLAAHRTYLAALGGDMADPGAFLREHAAAAAERLPGARFAATFELIPV
ncbi:MAG: GlcNAc-PI de-N-acetylase [Pseudonocardia sp. SCN 72-86]|nr:MAG: GlcNAc-PI de-N-acetylase [Pseudonocardia sp. SCN 72-86]